MNYSLEEIQHLENAKEEEHLAKNNKKARNRHKYIGKHEP
ncbi:38181_t:CDS:2 [Gigaspora margarita]|uniref:38181_t:CDS:1 n=1 Tax=Gigaspora margarita TaxID=4874 RepID=A0ABN7ULU7_GIGMA|nr:38181_t:CDS:2 [Gigaspora margarita]